jgi:hypothetical protein
MFYPLWFVNNYFRSGQPLKFKINRVSFSTICYWRSNFHVLNIAFKFEIVRRIVRNFD